MGSRAQAEAEGAPGRNIRAASPRTPAVVRLHPFGPMQTGTNLERLDRLIRALTDR
jgi:hypothetical protein